MALPKLNTVTYELEMPSSTCTWKAPVAYPDDGKAYGWDEGNQTWVEEPTQLDTVGS